VPRKPSKLYRLTAGAMIASLMTEACGAGWHQPPDDAPGFVPVRQQVQVWKAGHVLRWHAVAVTPDFVTGIPFRDPVDCDSCRLSIPRSRVDSLRLGNPTAGFWKTFALVVGIPIVAFAVLCGSESGGPPCSD
jgi:hypothetical protein